jgi:hypothetical protein
MSIDDEDNLLPEQSTFAVVVSPVFDDHKRWTGRITVHMEEDDMHDLDDDEIMQVRTVCGMMAATLTLMEEDTDFSERLQEYFMANFRSFIEDTVEGVLVDDEEDERPNMTRSEDGKVITLDFSSKTYGEA